MPRRSLANRPVFILTFALGLALAGCNEDEPQYEDAGERYDAAIERVEEAKKELAEAERELTEARQAIETKVRQGPETADEIQPPPPEPEDP